VRVNIANYHLQLHQPVEALAHFEQFLIEAPTAPPAQRSEIERQIRELRGQVAEVRVEIGPTGVRDPIVSIDGRATAIGNVVRMTPGRHVIEVSADGYVAARTEVDVAAGARRDVRVALRPVRPAPAVAAAATPSTTASAPPVVARTEVPAPAAATPEPAPPTQPTTRAAATSTPPVGSVAATTTPVETPVDEREARGLPPGFFYAGVGVTAAGAVAWGVFGLLALGANGTYEDAASRIQRGEGNYDDQYDRGYIAAVDARNYALASDIALGLTGAAAVTTFVLFLNTRWNRPVTATPVVSAHGAGLAIGGTF
jgi:hypothetical protein